MADTDPIVLLDDAALDALPAVTDQPPLSAANEQYLRSQGVTAPATWAAFQLGQVDAASEARLLTPYQRRGLRSGGIWLPTFDPRQPSDAIGLIRLAPAQHKHAFVTAPAGLMAPADIDQHGRVVLTDTPLLALRLHQEGVGGVACVEDIAVLAPIAGWLKARDVVIISTKRPSLATMQAALEAIGVRVVHALCIPAVIERISDKERKRLGLAPKPVIAPVPTTPLSLTTLRDLYEYAVRQRETEAGMVALRAAGLDHPDLITAYRPGYLPDRFRDLLPADQRGNFGRDWKGNCVVLPVFDERGAVVDLVAIKPDSNHIVRSLWPEPRGLLAPVLATACEHLVVTDTPRRLRRLTRDGIPALLLRGPADAEANAARLAAGGVRSVEVHASRDGDAIGAALAAAGISVTIVRNPYGDHPASIAALCRARTARRSEAAEEAGPDAAAEAHVVVDEAGPALAPAPTPAIEPAPPAPPAPEPVAQAPATPPPPPPPAAPPVAALPTLVLVEHDRQGECAVYRFGAGTYRVTIPHRPTSTLAITVTGPLRCMPMSCDLAVEAARKRNAAMVALSTGLAGSEVTAAFVAILPAVLALVEPATPAIAPLNPASVPMNADDRAEAMALLTAPDLVERSVADLGRIGADAADPATTIAWLGAISRLSNRPLGLVLTATAADERFPVMAAIAQATPADQCFDLGRSSAEALYHLGADGLRHHLLTVGDAAALSERMATALRLLHDRGVLATATVERTVQHGGLRTRVTEIHGPVALLGTATTAIPHGLDHHLFAVPVDDTPEAQTRQRQAEVAPMADPAALAAAQRNRTAAIRRLQNAQRLLIPRPVAIPDLDSVSLPAALARSRLHHDTLVGLIQASALLHQHQRPTVEGCVVATSADTEIAVRLLHHVAALQSGGLSRSAHRVLTAVWSAKLTAFTMPDLHRLLGWDRHVFRAALDELMRLDYIAAPRGVRGQFREYRLITTAPDRPAVVRMPPAEADVPPETAHG